MAIWKECTLSDLGTVVGGATPSTKDESNYENGNIPWITPKDLSAFTGRYIFSGERNITLKGLNSCSAQMLPKDTVLFSSRAPIGYVAIAGCPVCTNQGFKSIVPNDKTDSLFLYYLLKYNKEKIENMGSGTTFKEVSGGTMRNIKVIVPEDKDVQIKIGKILGSIDDKIEANTQINNNLQQQAHAIYREWFINFTPFGGKVPNGWEYCRLKDILELKKRTIKPGENTELPYLPIDTIPMKTFSVSEFRPNEEAQSSLLKFCKDDIIIGAMRVYFHRVVLAPCDGITRTTCFTLRPYNEKYLGYALLTCDLDSSIDFAQKSSKGSTMPYAVWEGGMGEIEIISPPEDIAEQFNEIILPLLRQIHNSCFEIRYLRNLRDALLPKLMSGELDVSEIDI